MLIDFTKELGKCFYCVGNVARHGATSKARRVPNEIFAGVIRNRHLFRLDLAISQSGQSG